VFIKEGDSYDKRNIGFKVILLQDGIFARPILEVFDVGITGDQLMNE